MEKDQDIYLKVEEEFNSDKRQEALWIKSLTLCQGDEQKAKYKYIELRVEQIKETEIEKQAIKDVRRYEGTIVNAASVRQLFNIDKKESYILRLREAGVNATTIYKFLDNNPKARGIYNKAGGGKPGLASLAHSTIIGQRLKLSNNSELYPKKGKKLSLTDEIFSQYAKELVNPSQFPDHWARKVFLVVYPAMFVGGFIEVLTEGVKNPLRFTFNAIFEGGFSTIAFVAFIIGVIWTLAVKKGKEISQ